MASGFVQTRVRKIQRHLESHLPKDSSLLSEDAQSAPRWSQREEHRDQGDSLRGQLREMDEHVARLQDTLRCERTKCNRLQLQSNQHEAELRRREQHCNRLKERLAQLTDRPRDKAASIEVLNFPTGCRGKRGQPVRSLQSAAKREETSLRLMLERREAELREAMKLRHSLTTLLHALREDMERMLSDCEEAQDEAQKEDEDDKLSKAEEALGDHVTGGVVHSWRRVQSRVGDFLSEGHAGFGTDHDKLLAQLETELKQSQQIVKLQQQMLQDGLVSPVPSELADCYFLEEWERLQARWAELGHQKQTFERERQLFTDAAIRLSHERRDFQQQKALVLKQQYLCDSSFGTGAQSNGSAAFSEYAGLGPSSISSCLPITPSSSNSVEEAALGPHQGRVQTPSTPELYSALSLSYNCRGREGERLSVLWDGRVDRIVLSPQAQHLDWSF